MILRQNRHHSRRRRPVRIVKLARNHGEFDVGDSAADLARDLQSHSSVTRMAEKIEQLETLVQHLLAENARLRDQAQIDPLTGLGNRRRFERALESAVSYARRHKGQVSLLLADLDGFKGLNDAFGHPAGDDLLRCVAGILRTSTRTSDEVVRLGGDEFAIVMPGTPVEGAVNVAERIRRRVAALPTPAIARISVSIGIAGLEEWRHPEQALRDLVCRADAALYQAKHRGKDTVEVADLAELATVAA